MGVTKLPVHAGLQATSRLNRLTSDAVAAPLADWLLLIVFGSVAAFSSTCLDLGIQRVPGHAILRVVFPLSLGLALVPRHGAGTVMGGSAFVTAMILRAGGVKSEGLGLGALTSLLATGPILDLVLRRANSGWKQYLAFGLAGIVSNLTALLVRGSAKALGLEMPGRRPLGEWLSQASVTYVACGLIAGLVSGIVLFYASRSSDSHRH